MKLQIGDCVQLKTGGCLMTVSNIVDLASAKGVDCQWFNDAGELKSGRFAPEALRRWVLDLDSLQLPSGLQTTILPKHSQGIGDGSN